MKAPGDERRRIFLLFSLGIAAPSFLLGYLPFRGIQNDRALVEQQVRSEHRLIAVRIGESLDARIEGIERALDRTTGGLPEVGLDRAPEVLDDLRLGEPAIQGFLLLLPDGSVRFQSPRPLLSTGSDRLPSTPSADRYRVSSALEAGRVSELRDRDYGRALATYRSVFAAASDPRVRGEALSAIARVQAKSGAVDAPRAVGRRPARRSGHPVASRHARGR